MWLPLVVVEAVWSALSFPVCVGSRWCWWFVLLRPIAVILLELMLKGTNFRTIFDFLGLWLLRVCVNFDVWRVFVTAYESAFKMSYNYTWRVEQLSVSTRQCNQCSVLQLQSFLLCGLMSRQCIWLSRWSWSSWWSWLFVCWLHWEEEWFRFANEV